MKEHFFITGYPRSRTAWMANLLSTTNSFCWHDALHDCQQIETVWDKMEQPVVPVVGLSDPAIVLFWENFVDRYPKAKWVVIERDLQESYSAMVTAGGVPMRVEFFTLLQRQLEKLIERVRPLVIPFDDITPSVARKVGTYLGVELGPRERIEQLCETNVQVHNLAVKMGTYQPPQFLLNLH